MTELIETRHFRWHDTSRGTRWVTSGTCTVRCVLQRGVYYADVHTLNASYLGVGSTPDEAFADWARKHGGNVRVVSAP